MMLNLMKGLFFSIYLWQLLFHCKLVDSFVHGCVGSKCFYLIQQDADWFQAERFCEDHFVPSGHLASIQSESERSTIRFWLPFVNTNLFVGGIRFGENEPWHWPDGSPFVNNGTILGNQGNCLAICHSNGPVCRVGHWIAEPCNSTHMFICENGTSVQPTAALGPQRAGPDTCNPRSQQCFSPLVADYTWAQAEQYCQSQDMISLASINGLLDRSFVQSTLSYPGMSDRDIWLGGFEFANSAIQWTNASPFNYTNWAAGQPNGPGCIKVCSRHQLSCNAGEWKMTSCTDQLSFICKHPRQHSLPKLILDAKQL